MSSITENGEQYANSRKLAARGRLVSEYTIAETPWFEWVARNLPVATGQNLLDIGCGPGWFWAATIDTMPGPFALTLADLSPGMVQEALERCRSLPFAALDSSTADAAALPFADETFDGVVAMHMLYHVAEPARAIAEAWRVLKPGGFLAVTTNGLGDMIEIYRLTTLIGSTPANPAALAFGFGDAERLMKEAFGNVAFQLHPAFMRITSAEDVVLAMTSFPPGDRASPEQIAAFRAAVDAAFAENGGVLTSAKETGLFISRKPG